MNPNDMLAETVNNLCETAQLNNTIDALDETIVPNNKWHSFSSPELIISKLPEFSLDPRSHTPADLVMSRTIGEGGMGLIRLAQQVPLGRNVAVKSLKRDGKVSGALRAILQEAWITGWLEHPNIVPIYTLGRDHQGSPLIVMKRIEGRAWSDYIHQPNEIHRTKKIYDLNWHLNVLIDVCNAMEYAHDRKIVHRDLKPENIMIGQFGEVYVLDWGIAVSLEEDLEGRLPLAKNATEMAGTPVYMAPEAALSDEPADERLDIYLLGAILHEILTLKPPHDAPTLNGAVLSAVMSKPKTFDAHVPSELASICNTAMQRDKSKRYQSVKSFRTAIQFYIEHKSSIDLSKQATTSLRDFEQLLVKNDEPSQMAAHYGEAHFGFRQALRIWPQNQNAYDGFVHCLMLKLKQDLKADNLGSAQAIITELESLKPPVSTDLTEFKTALAKKQAHQLALTQRAKELDFSIGARAKLFMALILAVAWSALPIVTGYMEDTGSTQLTHQSFILGAVRVFAIAAVVIIAFRKALWSNKANRRMTIALIGLPTCMIALRSVIALNDIPLKGMLAVEVILYAFFLLHLALTTNFKLIAGFFLWLVAAVAMSTWPQYDDYILGVSNLFVILGVIYVWTKSAMNKKQNET